VGRDDPGPRWERLPEPLDVEGDRAAGAHVWLYRSSKDDPHAVPTTVTLVERGATTEVTLRILYGSKEERDEKVAKYYAA
jgi:hypothetical protein